MPSGRFLMEDFYYAGGLPAVMTALGEAGLLHRGRAHRQWQDHLARIAKDAPSYNPEVIRPLDKPLTAEGGIAVLRGNLAPAGRRAQALGGDAGADAASRPRRRLREHRGLSRRASTIRLSISTRPRHGAEELRAQGLSGHGRGRQYGAAAEAAEEGRHRHGAHLRCADERHRLWHGRAACRAGSRGRRAAGPGAGRRHDRARRGRAQPGASGRPTSELGDRRRDWQPPAPPRRRLPAALCRARAAGRPGLRPRLPGRRRGAGSRGNPTERRWRDR